jgi:HD-like signal output (HDOD) protein
MGTSAGVTAANSERLLRSANSAPPFSPILNRLLASLAKEDVLLSAVSDLVQKDTVLAGSLLRTVNSAAYGMAGKINSVQHALAIMGLDRVRNLVMTLSFAGLWSRNPPVPGWSAARFNLHATATAVLSDILVQHMRVEYPEGAFVAGLLHDFGKLLVVTELPAEFGELRARLESGAGTAEQAEIEILGITHAEVAAAAMKCWNLPAPISEAVRTHHADHPRRMPPVSLARTLQAADRCVNRMGIHVLESHPEAGLPPEEVLEELGAGAPPDYLLQEFSEEFAVAKAFF